MDTGKRLLPGGETHESVTRLYRRRRLMGVDPVALLLARNKPPGSGIGHEALKWNIFFTFGTDTEYVFAQAHGCGLNIADLVNVVVEQGRIEIGKHVAHRRLATVGRRMTDQFDVLTVFAVPQFFMQFFTHFVGQGKILSIEFFSRIDNCDWSSGVSGIAMSPNIVSSKHDDLMSARSEEELELSQVR